MSSTGAILRHYLERALVEAGAQHTVRDPDVRAELDAMAAGVDRLEDTARMMERLEARVVALEILMAAIRAKPS